MYCSNFSYFHIIRSRSIRNLITIYILLVYAQIDTSRIFMQNAVELSTNFLDKCLHIRYSFRDCFHFIHKLSTVYQ